MWGDAAVEGGGGRRVRRRLRTDGGGGCCCCLSKTSPTLAGPAASRRISSTSASQGPFRTLSARECSLARIPSHHSALSRAASRSTIRLLGYLELGRREERPLARRCKALLWHLPRPQRRAQPLPRSAQGAGTSCVGVCGRDVAEMWPRESESERARERKRARE